MTPLCAVCNEPVNVSTQAFDRLGEAWIHGRSVTGTVRFKNVFRHTACGNLGRSPELEGQLSIDDV